MRSLFLIALLATSAFSFVVDHTNVAEAQAFGSWQTQFSKAYETDEDLDHAFENFQATLKRVANMNADQSDTVYAPTKFADLSPEEFKAMLLTYKNQPKNWDVAVLDELDGTPTSTFDWRNKGAVTAVKDQGQCGSCWAFSATEGIESMWFQAGNSIPTLVPQQIVDCDKVDQGCNGGNTETAFEYVTKAGGLDEESSYPYVSGGTGAAGTCKVKPADFGAHISNYTYAITPCPGWGCNAQNETALQIALYNIGPLSICLNAQPWQDYSSGVLTAAQCPHALNDMDHCVQLVGYNWPQNYWIVRNSWNTDWGVDGYIYLQTMHNTCGLANDVDYPNVASN